MWSNVGYYIEMSWSTKIIRSSWSALRKHTYWFGSIWDIGFELEYSHKSNLLDANESRSRGYGYHTFCYNYIIISEENLQFVQCGAQIKFQA